MSDSKYFIDTNIFLRSLIKEDLKVFAACTALLEAVKEGRLGQVSTSSLVLSEITWVLKGLYGFSKKDIIRAQKGIISLPHLTIEDHMAPQKGIYLYEKYSVKFIDALIASNPSLLEHKTIIVSYDKDFDKLGLLRKTPEKIL